MRKGIEKIFFGAVALTALMLFVSAAWAHEADKAYGGYVAPGNYLSHAEWDRIKDTTKTALATKDISVALEKLVYVYNFYIVKVPAPVRSVIGSERVNVRVNLDGCGAPGFEIASTIPEKFKVGGFVTIGMDTKDDLISSTSLQEISNPTIVASTNESTICRVMASSDPEATIRAALANKEINYEATTIQGKAKFFIFAIVDRIIGFFSWVAGIFAGLFAGR